MSDETLKNCPQDRVILLYTYQKLTLLVQLDDYLVATQYQARPHFIHNSYGDIMPICYTKCPLL